MKAHTDEQIISKASLAEKNQEQIKDDKIDIAVDLDDETGTCHTYVVTFDRSSGEWKPVEVEEVSSL